MSGSPSEVRPVVLVTGASSGIGAAIAEAGAAAGWRLALAARREDRLCELAERLPASAEALVLPADVSDPASIASMVRSAEAHFGRIDALVANAGMLVGGPFARSGEEELRQQWEVNVLGVLRCCRAVLPGMLARGAGHLVVISSVAGDVPSARMVLYAATKGAVTAFAEGLRREVAPRGVRVTTVVPGFIATEMTQGLPMRLPPASVVGDLVVDVIRRPRRRAVVPRWYGVWVWGNRLAPGLTDRVLEIVRRRRQQRR